MKRCSNLILGCIVVIIAFCFTIVGEQCSAAGIQPFGTGCTIIGYLIPIFPVYKLYSNISNKKIAGIMVAGWCLLSASVFFSAYNSVLQFLGGSLTVIPSTVAVYKAGEKIK